MMNPGASVVTPDLTARPPLVPGATHANGKGHPNGNGHASVLTSWKEIAHYMGKGVRTVQRWEQDFGLPVRRPLGSNKKAILARPMDLDAWVAMRCSSRAGECTEMGRPAFSADSLSKLVCGIETSRMLRSSNQALLKEVGASLEALRSQIRDFPAVKVPNEIAPAA